MMTFRHRFEVRAPLEAVAAFHHDPRSLRALTPLLDVRFEQLPDPVRDGDELVFRIGLGRLGFRWRARIEALSATGFVDRQVDGPFRCWVHRHRFVPRGPGSTVVLDEVEAAPARHPLRGPLGLGMWLSLPLLFAFRAWKTRRALE